MSEQVIDQPPSAEELGEEYKGLTFSVFKDLSDGQVEDLIYERHLEVLENHRIDLADSERVKSGRIDFDAISESFVFGNFIRWRKFGIPDKQVTFNDIDEYLGELVKIRHAADPNYGLLTPEQFSDRRTSEKRIINDLFQYLYSIRDRFEYLIIDEYSLFGTIGFSISDVELLVKIGVLQGLGESSIVGKNYAITNAYYDHWLTKVYPNKSVA